MNQLLSLNGPGWQLKPFYGEDWLLRKSYTAETKDTRGWIPATVPGSVVNDAWAAGLVPNPYQGMNTLAIEWTADRTWVYKRTFKIGPLGKGTRARLVFQGVDYSARFFLNDQYLGEHQDMYTPAVFEVTALLKPDADNLLAVVIDPAPVEWPQIGYTSKVRTNKSRMTYWWDFCPRMVHQGIWDRVDLLLTGPAALANVWVRPTLNEDYSSAKVTVQAALDTLKSAQVEVEARIFFEGQELAHASAAHRMKKGGGEITLRTELPRPRLWWVNGFGDQPLYRAEITVRESGEISDQQAVTFGIRDLRFIPNENADPNALPYTLQINGQRIYTRGWNWVPLDVLYGPEREAKREHLLRLAKEGNVTLLRVWGGGLIEKEAFYELCDRLGILVWQEFIQSSSGIDNLAPEEEEWIRWFSSEAREIVRKRRNHPSLAVWCGGNELMWLDGRPLDDTHPMLSALKSVVQQLDPGRAWLPTSSSGPFFSNEIPSEARPPAGFHDVHGPWEYQGVEQQYALYNNATSLFHSEFGAEGLTNRRALDTVLPQANQVPVTLDNPNWMHLAAWWVKSKVWSETFGELQAVEDFLKATQFMQFEGVRYAIEANRRRAFHNSGSMPWQFNEPYPNPACTSAVDYFGEPKPLYYGVKRAFAPTVVTAKYATIAWAGRDTFEAEVWCMPKEGAGLENARLSWALMGLDGGEYASGDRAISAPDDHPLKASTVRFPVSKFNGELFLLDLMLSDASGNALASNRYLFSTQANLAPIFSIPEARVKTSIEKSAETWQVALSNPGSVAVMYAWLEREGEVSDPGWARFSNNYFILLPGERREVRVTWEGVEAGQRGVKVSAWNI